MSIRITQRLRAAFAFGIAALLAPAAANADLVLQLQEQGSTSVIERRNSDDMGPASYSGNVGNFTVDTTTGSSNSPGDNGLGRLSLGTITITNNSKSTKTLLIRLTAQNFGIANGTVSLEDTVSGSLLNGSVNGTFQAYGDDSNAEFGQAVAGELLSFSASGNSQSFSTSGAPVVFNATNPYSLSIFSSYTLGGKSRLTLTGGNATVTAVPEPASFASCGAGLGLLALARRYRRRRLAVA